MRFRNGAADMWMWTRQTGKALRLCGLLLGAAILFGTALYGHHSFAAFDMAKTVMLTGVVKEFQWVNPHSWIQVMAPDSGGNSVEWSIELNSPSSLVRKGWKPKTLKPGDKIALTIHPLRDGRPGGSLVSLTLPDGTRMGGSPTGEPQTPN